MGTRSNDTVMERTMRMLTLDEFAELVQVSGFEGLSESLGELVTHGVLVPVQVKGEARFDALQLFSLHRYARVARVWAHLWHDQEANPPEIQAITDQAALMTSLSAALRHITPRPPSLTALTALVEDLEEDLEAFNPFGAMSVMTHLVSQDVLATMRGDARLYVEMRAALDVLRAQVDALDSTRTTQDMPAPASLLASSTPTMPHIKTPELSSSEPARSMGAANPVRVTAEMSAVENPLPTIEPVTSSTAPLEASMESESIVDHVSHEAVTLYDDEGAEQGVSDSDVRPAANPFARDPSQSTSNTQDLQKRLEALRHLDGRTAAAAPAASSLAQKAIALSKARQEDRATMEVEERLTPPSLPELPINETLPIVQEELVEFEGEEFEGEEFDGDALEPHEEEISLDLSQESPLVLDDDELEDFFSDDSQTMVLNSHELRDHALADAEHVDESPAEASKEESWGQQIEDLNAKREAYMNAQNWSGLVTLYEDGVELFEGSERQQVYLTLAKLYELKIDDTARALENMALAFEMGGDEAVLRKIIDALRRLGNGPTRPALMAWVEVQLGSGQWGFAITEALQRMRAGLLHETGDPQRGFLMYASFVADAPDLAATDSGLDFLETLAEGVDATELYELYDELIEQTLDRTLSYHLNSRAGFFALQRDNMERAVVYLECALELDPAQEQLFHVLSQVYEEEEQLSALIVLYERRSRAITGEAQEALREKLEMYHQQEQQQPELCRAQYAERLERSPQDDVLLECMMRSFIAQELYIDGYAFLNRHLENVTAVASRVRALQTLSTLALQYLDSPEEALVHLEEALEHGGARKSLLERLIMINLDLEDWRHVLHYIERLTGELAAEMTQEEEVRWLLAGVQAAQSLDLVDKERFFLERTLQIMPEHDQARQALAAIS